MDELTDAEEMIIRAWVGDDVDISILQERYNRLGDIDEVILEELNSQLANLLSQPTSISVDGISISTGSNVSGLRDRLKDFRAVGGTGVDDTAPSGGIAVHKLVRHDTR